MKERLRAIISQLEEMGAKQQLDVEQAKTLSAVIEELKELEADAGFDGTRLFEVMMRVALYLLMKG